MKISTYKIYNLTLEAHFSVIVSHSKILPLNLAVSQAYAIRHDPKSRTLRLNRLPPSNG